MRLQFPSLVDRLIIEKTLFEKSPHPLFAILRQAQGDNCHGEPVEPSSFAQSNLLLVDKGRTGGILQINIDIILSHFIT
jgi:hypothetical protein